MIHRNRDGNRSAARRTATVLGAALTAASLSLAAALPAAAEQMRITFIRHGESYGNLSGNIDTQVPGPVLTPLGQQQAQAIVGVLGDNNYDAIYASDMVRTQQTATPMSQYLGLPIQVLPGLREIQAGAYEGTAERPTTGTSGYLTSGPLRWIGLIPSAPGVNPLSYKIPDKVDPVTGEVIHPGESGIGFDTRVDNAIWTMHQNGDRNVAAFSHGGTIMFWVLINAENADPLLVFAQPTAEHPEWGSWHPLGNTDYVVVEGDPETGVWRVVNWNGVQVAEHDPFRTVLWRQSRTLSGQLNEAGQSVLNSLTTGNPFTVATAINRATTSAAFSIEKFGRAMNADMIDRVERAVENPQSVLDEAQNSLEMLGAVANTWVPAELSSALPSLGGASTSSLTGNSNQLRAKLQETADKVTGALSGNSGAANDLPKNVGAQVRKGLTDTQNQVSQVVKDATNGISKSVKQVRDTINKATGNADAA